MLRERCLILVMAASIVAASACNAQPTQPPPTWTPTQVIAPLSTPSVAANLPLSETDVPRVSLEDAKAALDSGEAVIVDVRSADAYAASHIPGAINIQLGEIESNPTALNLDKNRWIITYCT